MTKDRPRNRSGNGGKSGGFRGPDKGKPWPRDFDKGFRESSNVSVEQRQWAPNDPEVNRIVLTTGMPGAERLDPQMRADIEAAAMRDRAIMRQSTRQLPASLPPGYRF